MRQSCRISSGRCATPSGDPASRRVEPDKAGTLWRRLAIRQGADPPTRGTIERGREEARIPCGQRPVRGRGPNDPDDRDTGRPVIACQHGGEIGRLGLLSTGRAYGSPDVAERVPCLLDDQGALRPVPDRDIDGVPRVQRPRRELGDRASSGPGRELQQGLLHLEMAGIDWLRTVDRLREGDREWPIDRHSDGDPGREGDAFAATELDVADPCLVDLDRGVSSAA